jgi:hypothetical protein
MMSDQVAECAVGQAVHMDFNLFRAAVAKQFKIMSAHELFRSGVSKDG